jgi:hypothetical protein
MKRQHTGMPFDWCGCSKSAQGDCDTCEGRSDSDPLPFSWERPMITLSVAEDRPGSYD